MKKIIAIKDFFKIFISKIQKSDLPDGGFVIAYNMLFSLFPLIIVTLNIVSFVYKGREEEVLKILAIFPQAAAEVVEPVINELIQSSSAGLLSISLLIALWSGSRATQKLMNEIAEAFTCQRNLGFVREKLLAIVLALALVLSFIVILVTGPLASIIFGAIESVLGETLVVSFLFQLMVLLLPYVFLFVILTIIYKMSVFGTDVGIMNILPASVFTAIAMFVLTAGFTVYVENFGNYTKTYGSLGGVIVLLLWLFLTGVVMVLGGYFASSLMEHRKQKTLMRNNS